MSNEPEPIQLTPNVARADLTPEQLTALVETFANAEVFAAPEGKTLADVKHLSVAKLPNGKGRIIAVF